MVDETHSQQEQQITKKKCRGSILTPAAPCFRRCLIDQAIFAITRVGAYSILLPRPIKSLHGVQRDVVLQIQYPRRCSVSSYSAQIKNCLSWSGMNIFIFYFKIYSPHTRLILSKVCSFKIRHATFPNNIKFTDLLIVRLQNCEWAGQVGASAV